jgi:hypothetical protein
MANASPQKLEYVRQYDKENCIRMNFKFNKKTDADILEKLTSVDRKQTYIKKLIREDLEREKELNT